MVEMITKGTAEALLTELEGKAKARDQRLRIRMQPTVLDVSTSTYRAVPGVSWMFEVETAAGVMEFKQAIDEMIQLGGLLGGTEQLIAYLRDCQATVKEPDPRD
jgi:hypothetical protein